nr:MAG TPA: hypothetical protein [Caudoviricetes sp.]
MPNYKNTLIKTTTVPVLELTDELQNTPIALMTSAVGYDDSDFSDIFNVGGNYTVTVIGKNSAIKVKRKLWLDTVSVNITNTNGRIKIQWIASKSKAEDEFNDDVSFNGLGLNPTTIFLPLGLTSYEIPDSITFYGIYTAVTDEFTMYFYKSTAEKNRMDKSAYLTEIIQSTGTLRRATSIISPEFEFIYNKVPDFNYVYIPNFNRYYFIDNIVSLRNNVWTLSLSVDVLMSFKEQIKECDGFIARNEFEFNDYLIDNRRSTQVNVVREIKPFTQSAMSVDMDDGDFPHTEDYFYVVQVIK